MTHRSYDNGGGNSHLVNMNRPLLRAFRAVVAYDGTAFSGSQLQPDDRTVLGEINKALEKVLAHPVRAKAASRTDASVHAVGQVIGFRTGSNRTASEIKRALNGLLPGDVRITDCREVDFDFHPRWSALGKIYIYKIFRGPELPPVLRNYVAFVADEKRFDSDVFENEIRQFCGEHDFRSFSPRLMPGEKPVKKVQLAGVKCDPPLYEAGFLGSGFLYQMVRRMVGLAMSAAMGREKPGCVLRRLENPELGSVKYNAAPQGLYLEKVFYSEREIEEAIRAWSVEGARLINKKGINGRF